MKLIRIFLINLYLMINQIRSEYDLDLIFKGWETTCKITSCESTLNQCIVNSCLGKPSCRSCVETYLTSCSRCVDEIYDETTQITLPDNRKTIICDMNNQLHTTVCNFFCRSLFKLNYKCEIISDMPVCNCMDSTTPTTSSTTSATTTLSTTLTTTTITPTPTPTTYSTTTTKTPTTLPTTLTTTSKKPDNPSNILQKLASFKN